MSEIAIPWTWRLLRILGKQDWIRKGIRDQVIRSFCNPDILESIPFESTYLGLRYKGDLSSYLDWCVFFFGAYEKSELFLLRDLLKNRENAVFVDVGANVGLHSLYMAQFCRRVISFEPFPRVRDQMVRQLELNQIKNVSVMPFGLGVTSETKLFKPPDGCNQGTGTFQVDADGLHAAHLLNLKIVRGDEALDQLNLEKVDLIKIDVEGFEHEVLEGLQNTLRKYRPTVFLEVTDPNPDTAMVEKKLLSFLPEGYSFQAVLSNTPFFGLLNRARCTLPSRGFSTRTDNVLLLP